MASAIFSINNQYTKLIFSGEKDLEFRNTKTKLTAGDIVYIYETKKNKGSGKVVGQFTCKDIKEIPYHKLGSYNFIQHYVDKFGTKEEQDAVRSALEVELTNTDNCLVLSYIFDYDRIERMKFCHMPINQFEMYVYPSTEKIRERYKAEDKSNELVQRCDEWLQKIGFFNKDDNSLSTWKYVIEIKDVVKYDMPIDITKFEYEDGRQILKAPQSFCYVKFKKKV